MLFGVGARAFPAYSWDWSADCRQFESEESTYFTVLFGGILTGSAYFLSFVGGGARELRAGILSTIDFDAACIAIVRSTEFPWLVPLGLYLDGCVKEEQRESSIRAEINSIRRKLSRCSYLSQFIESIVLEHRNCSK